MRFKASVTPPEGQIVASSAFGSPIMYKYDSVRGTVVELLPWFMEAERPYIYGVGDTMYCAVKNHDGAVALFLVEH